MIFYLIMVNAWSLLGSIVNGTFEEDYPLMDKSKGRWTEEDQIRELDDYCEDSVISPLESDEYDILTTQSSAAHFPSASKTASAQTDLYDGLDYEDQLYSSCSGDDYIADIDDQYAHHFKPKMDYEPQRNHQYKYHEEEILKDIEEYVSSTYQGHYTGTKHEFRKVQTIDLMAARDIAAQFCQANILKYGSRYGSKDGRNKKDLLKVIHYAMLLAHFDGHYGEPSMPSDDFEQMP